jgi:hypothetical protein
MFKFRNKPLSELKQFHLYGNQNESELFNFQQSVQLLLLLLLTGEICFKK